MTAVNLLAYRGIVSYDIFAVNFRRDGYVLTNWKAKDVVTVGEFETIANEKGVIFGT